MDKDGDDKTVSEDRPGVVVEISEEKLKELLDSAELKIGRDVRVVKGLEIRPGSIIARQYDR